MSNKSYFFSAPSSTSTTSAAAMSFNYNPPAFTETDYNFMSTDFPAPTTNVISTPTLNSVSTTASSPTQILNSDLKSWHLC